MQQVVGRRLINPALLIVLLAGVYLASNLHQWSVTYVQWGLAAVVVLGGLEGGFMIPCEGRLADLAERDLAAAAVSGSRPGAATRDRHVQLGVRRAAEAGRRRRRSGAAGCRGHRLSDGDALRRLSSPHAAERVPVPHLARSRGGRVRDRHVRERPSRVVSRAAAAGP
jgi:hypothetical protein